MNCAECGTYVQPGTRWCTSCGSPLPPSDAAARFAQQRHALLEAPADAWRVDAGHRPRRPFRSTWKNAFLFQGRIGRGEWWTLSILTILIALFGLLLVIRGSGVNDVVGVGLMLIAYWITLAATVKRWHDRDKSGAWLFIGFVPWVGEAWAFLEPAFLDGTPGPNTYGDPDSGSVLD